MNLDIELIKKCYDDFVSKKSLFDKMYDYYKGNTDAIKGYKMVTERSNNKTPVNYVKKFVKEEVSYSVGNDVTYISKEGNSNILKDIDYYTSHWSAKHDSDLAKKMLIFGYNYELYYIDREAQFCSKIISPREGYAYTNDYGEIVLFLHIFTKRFDETIYIDVYDNKQIYHFDSNFEEVATSTTHIFEMVPVGMAQVSAEKEDDTIYKDIKGLQDAYETNLSDISNEISDFRNAYLFVSGFQIDEDDIPKMKELGVIQVPTSDGKATWLIKNINDSFIQNTLSTLEDKMYQLSSHINHNEKMQSNLSGVALRSRLISLEEKCKLNQKAISDCIKTRLKLLFVYLNEIKGLRYDYKDIKIQYTPNIPQDDLNTAQIISQLGDKLSLETGLAQLSFINNASNEVEKIKAEQSEVSQGKTFLDNVGVGEDGQV
ncbi:MAG: phage portal protein [Clostridiaceae bacterium]